MAVAYVKGLQGNDPHYLKLAATLKHFAVNNVEAHRTGLDATVPERWLREYWLPHWRDAVVEGKACSLMASYNGINGTPNVMNHWLLTDVLKKEWNHEGFVVSDLGGVDTMVRDQKAGKITYEDAVAASIMAGCDFSDKEFQANIPAAVKDGKLDESRLNDALKRVMRVRMRLGEFDPQERLPWHNLKPEIIDSAEHRAVALRAAQESMVLLKNDNQLLPLDRLKLKRVAVIGPCANRIQKNGYNGKSADSISALEGVKAALGPGCEVTFTVGGWINSKRPRFVEAAPVTSSDPAADLAKAVEAAKQADVALVFVGTDDTIEQEATDRKSLGLPGNQEELVEAVFAANPRTVVIQMNAGPLTTPWIKEHVPSVLQAWWPGGQGGTAIADVLFGKVNPAGRLPYTVYASESQVPPQSEYDISKGFTYMFVKGEPLWAFGHGLSYTSFQYSGLQTSPAKVASDETITAQLNVENTGKRAGDEVVQLYVKAVHSHVVRPAKALRGFERITLQPGEKKSVRFSVPVAKLAYWDDKSHGFKLESGDYEIQVGASSLDIRQTSRFTVTSGGPAMP
jgi:beta-glucosidase